VLVQDFISGLAVMRYFHDVNSIIKKRLKALILYIVFKKILTFDTLNRGRTVFFNGGNDDNLYQNIKYLSWFSAIEKYCPATI
jgi:hypothetical protein